MRRRRPHKPKEERDRNRRAVQECRDRQRRLLGLYYVACGSDVLDFLVAHHYLSDADVFDKSLVNRALSKLLWDVAHNLH
jgi:hypothetical protein